MRSGLSSQGAGVRDQLIPGGAGEGEGDRVFVQYAVTCRISDPRSWPCGERGASFSDRRPLGDRMAVRRCRACRGCRLVLTSTRPKQGLRAGQRRGSWGAGAKDRTISSVSVTGPLTTGGSPVRREPIPPSAEVQPACRARCSVGPEVRLQTLVQVVDRLGKGGRTGWSTHRRSEVGEPPPGRKILDRIICGKHETDAVRTLVLTDQAGSRAVLQPAQPTSRADITHARRSAHALGARRTSAETRHQNLGARTATAP